MNKSYTYLIFILLILSSTFKTFAQALSGTVKDKNTGETLIGASVAIKGTSIGTATDFEGKFTLETGGKSLPITLVITYIGYSNLEQAVTDLQKPVLIFLKPDEKILKEVNITDMRLTEKQRESALTVEAMDMLAIRQTPAANFYEGLGMLKGVDITSASLGFKIVNTRGFNSTSPVRTLQIIDGVDNQSPGLNFSLGNFLGASELDVLKTDLIVGASSAFYGPNAFNGVISITSRSPFVKPGFEISAKTGNRGLVEMAARYAYVFKNKANEDKLGLKFNAFLFKANDWEADNRAATPQSLDGPSNPGSYDAVNIYGDEVNNERSPNAFPGVGRFYRTGYAEQDLVDYNTNNIKLSAAAHYKVTKENELIFSSNYGTGTTVYQGDNRFSLKNIQFFQNRLEYRKPGKFFIRAYSTKEDAGDSYDAFFTALLLQQAVKSDVDWFQDYTSYFSTNRLYTKFRNTPGYPQVGDYNSFEEYQAAINPFLLQYYGDSMYYWHNQAAGYANTSGNPIKQNDARFEPGTAAFDSALAAITSRETFAEGGSKFYDRSALYHIHGEYKWDIGTYGLTTGGNYRTYRPDSRGTIFSDTLTKITNYEYGVYAGLDKKIYEDQIKLNATLRMDKNENFDYLFSPAVSAIYSPNENNTIRLSLSSAIRNPTLSDQYLYYQVGRAILVGNLTGFDSLVTIPSLVDGLSYGTERLVYFNADPVKPERVQTIEMGYRTSLWGHLYFDMNAYYSRYQDFIGYKIGAEVEVSQGTGRDIFVNQIYRVATNSLDIVTTHGISAGFNYYFRQYYSINGNWSWNELDRGGSDDPLIPAFNTPLHKFNIGVAGNDILNSIGKNWGFNINYRYVQGFLFEGSPQFTGEIPSYGLVDMQINKRFVETKTTFKAGITNLLDNQHYEVFGGPLIGRLVYFQVLVELN
jgi:iron complex outermembrane receptor protein